MFLKKWKIGLPRDPAIPLLGIYLKKITLTPKNIYTSMFIAALFTKTKVWEQPKCPSVDERTKKTPHTHTHTHTHTRTHARAHAHTHMHASTEYYSAPRKS